MRLRRVTATFCFVLAWTAALSQDQVSMADGLRAEGKIYVVVAVILVILGGLIAYLLHLDRKITRMEKKIDKRS